MLYSIGKKYAEKRDGNMKLNYIGIIAAILAFVSLALPWWAMSYSVEDVSYSMSLYPWGVTYTGDMVGAGTTIVGVWSTYGALALIILGGILGLVGSAMATNMGKMLLLAAGILTILAPIIFVLGFLTIPMGASFLFYSALGISASLSIGFGLAFIAAILAFIAWVKHPTATAPST